eukprot:GHUV01025045.1.p1 GENE.GHUV01025045.1~~GHUV01025045.1.p1  ORF type:complete len:114 (+),score=21.23 GHUV01025045.1:582-923(+)
MCDMLRAMSCLTCLAPHPPLHCHCLPRVVLWCVVVQEGADLAPTTPDAWTPFGMGPRMCIGWKFALQEAKIALIRLYQNQTYELMPGQVPLPLQQNLTLSPRNGVRVRVIPRA